MPYNCRMSQQNYARCSGAGGCCNTVNCRFDCAPPPPAPAPAGGGDDVNSLESQIAALKGQLGMGGGGAPPPPAPAPSYQQQGGGYQQQQQYQAPAPAPAYRATPPTPGSTLNMALERGASSDPLLNLIANSGIRLGNTVFGPDGKPQGPPTPAPAEPSNCHMAPAMYSRCISAGGKCAGTGCGF
jgi:hypothetical protein